MLLRFIFVMSVLTALLGCESLPKASYTTANGCGIAQWTPEFVQANVVNMSWSGPCVSGLAHGQGDLVVSMTGNRQRTYTGQMEKGFIFGDGTYTRESGWKYQGKFLWATFTGGKIYDSAGELIFDGQMAHNEKFEGRNLVYEDQRFHTGKLYWHDRIGTTVEDGRFMGSSGPGVGFTSVNVTTGAGLIFGKVIQNGRVVARWVEGRNYVDDTAYSQAQIRYFDKLMAGMDRDNEAYAAQQRAKNAEDTRQTISALGGALQAATGGQNANERLRLATESLNQSLSGSGGDSTSGGASSSSADNSGIEIAGSMKNCLKIVPASEDQSIATTGINANNGLKYNYVVVNKCNEDIEFHYCQITDSKYYTNGKVLERKFGCESLYGGDWVSKSGKIPKPDVSPDKHPGERFWWWDRKMLVVPQSWFVCNARTEQIRTITPYGSRLTSSNRQCVPRKGNPYTRVWPGGTMIPSGD